MKEAFTMVELIMVIVILGILGGVAFPKLLLASKTAKVKTVESFVATLNRTAVPSLWSTALKSADGDIRNLNIEEYIELPIGYTIDLTGCSAVNALAGTEVGTISTDVVPLEETIYCRNGTTITPPLFSFSADGNLSVQNN